MKRSVNSKFTFAISMAVFGTIGVFVRYIPLPSGEIALYRALLALVIVGAYLLISKQRMALYEAKKEIALLLLSGAAMGFNWIFLFEAYKYTTVSVATLSYYFAPVIVTVLSPILFKEKMTLKKAICFVFSSVGLVLLTGIGNMSGQESNLKGIGFGIGAACLYATVMLLNKAIKGISGIYRTFLQFASAAAVLIPYVLLSEGINIISLRTDGLICLLTVGVIHTGITYLLYFSSLKEIEGQQAAVLSYIDPLIAVVVSVFILKEEITAVQIIGGALILIFTLLNEISFKRIKK
ncbi:MAG: EamA family transporter [Clostridia bacterium]|nr:EamA family transporter [Clostridia bacterium]